LPLVHMLRTFRHGAARHNTCTLKIAGLG